MSIRLLDRADQLTFLDDDKYSGRAVSHLAGLACAIQDSHPDWRPTISELVSMLPRSDETNAIVAAGMAYGAAKAMMNDYPGPAILLFGAALNAIGSAPNTEMQESIRHAEQAITRSGLDEDPDVQALVRAARERASFDRVSQMLRDEFTEGLVSSGTAPEIISDVVPRIVNVTHDVRHKGLIERITWQNIVIEEGGSSSDAGWLHEIDEVIFTDDKLRELVPFAQPGCAHRILAKLLPRRRDVPFRAIPQ